MSESNSLLALAKRALRQKTLIIQELESDLVEEKRRRAGLEAELEALCVGLLVSMRDQVRRDKLGCKGPANQ